MRRVLWKIHSWTGLIAGLGLLIVGLSGSILMFRPEIERACSTEFAAMRPPPGAARLPVDELLRLVRESLPGERVEGWLDNRESGEADALFLAGDDRDEYRVAYLDPATGCVAAARSPRGTLRGWMLELHYSLFADHAGLAFVALLGVALLALGVSGIYLYRNFWKTLFRLRWRASARILFSDIHKFVGITFVAFNLILGFTGAYWNATHLLGHLMEPEPEAKPAKTAGLAGIAAPLGPMLTKAGEVLPGFRANFVSYADDGGKPVVALYGAVEPRGRFEAPYGDTVTFDAATGEIVSKATLADAGWWERATNCFAPLHYGAFGGLPVRILWCVGGLTPGLLGVSGFVLWWKRRRRKRS